MSIKLLNSHPSSDGAGVNIRRIHGFQDNGLSPFLMLDEIHSDNPEDYGAGFPAHPHRGIETLTYIRHGGFVHEDHLGNKGQITSGGAQWMSAGRGVIHSEMPLQKDGLLHGFQLWINLPAANKMKPAEWKDYPAADMKWQSVAEGVEVKAIAGQLDVQQQTYEGPIQQLPANATVSDLQIEAGKTAELSALAPNTMLFLYQGKLHVAGQVVSEKQLLQLTDETSIMIEAQQVSGLLVLQGEPINEPVTHHGPFVMNTEAEIRQAIRDYQLGQLTG